MTDQLSRVFAALADPTRRDIVARLTEADHTVNDLAGGRCTWKPRCSTS